MYVGMVLGWFFDGFGGISDECWLDLWWTLFGVLFFLCFLDCLNFMTFLKLMAIHGEVYGSVLAEFGRAMAKL